MGQMKLKLGTWFSAELGNVMFTLGLDDLKDLFQFVVVWFCEKAHALLKSMPQN